MRIAGSVAIVTGASSGIGAATAQLLAERGATVVAVARREDRLRAVVERCRQHSAESRAVPCDLADTEAIADLVDTVTRDLGRIDIVVNNAGIPLRRVAQETSMQELREGMEVNFFGAVELASRVLPGMVERGEGAIINVTSVVGYLPTPHESGYGASKAALDQWSHTAALDLDGTGVHVGVVAPGPIDTEIWDKDTEAAAYDGRLYPPEVVAEAIATSVERTRVHVTAPRRYGAMRVLYPALGSVLRRSLVAFERRKGDNRGGQ